MQDANNSVSWLLPFVFQDHTGTLAAPVQDGQIIGNAAKCQVDPNQTRRKIIARQPFLTNLLFLDSDQGIPASVN
jgi:hypothetical protein